MKKNHFYLLYIVLTFLVISVTAQNRTAESALNVAGNDTLTQTILLRDSIIPDSLPTDTLVSQKSAIEAPVSYAAKDSIVFTAGNLGYLFGEGRVVYQTIDLQAENITMSMDSSIVTAIYGIDSIGNKFGFPVFTDRDQSVEAQTMRYNFKTRKGFITGAITQQGEGFLNAAKAKRNNDGSFFIAGGQYTTCDEHDHPHFYIMLTKAKVRPGKDVITGPAYLVIEDLPIKFLGLPFAFFPFTEKYSSGVIMPSYGDELERGFNLRDGGYYFAINDYFDLALTGEIYTKGSWGLAARSSYNRRYKYSGSFNGSYITTVRGDKGAPDRSVSKDFRVGWQHSQDVKANMYRTVSASVNFSTSSYDRNSTTNIFSPQGNTSSTVNINQRFPNSPFSFNSSMSINQRQADSSVAITLPNLTVSMSRIAPFKRKEAVGSEKWYEKIFISYSGDFRNSVTTKEDRLFKTNLQKDWINGMRHSIPVSATFSLFNYFNITPSFNYNEVWHTRGVRQGLEMRNETLTTVPIDTFYRFKRVYDFNFSLAFQTKLFGFYEPLVNVFGIQRIRHVFTPSISFSARPDFSDPIFGFYESFNYIDMYGDVQTYTYSPYANGLFSVPSAGKQGMINFAFQNNIEAKVKNSQDSLVTKSLVDNLSINFSYNAMAPAEKWSDINTSLRLKLTKSLTLNINATFDPYAYSVDRNGRPYRDGLRLQRYGTIGRLKSTGYSFSPSINQDTFKKWFGKGSDSENGNNKDPNSETSETTENTEESTTRKSLLGKKADTGEYDENGYMKNEVKWNLSVNYSMNYGYGEFDPERLEFRGIIRHNFSLNGNIQPTKNWSFNFSTTYDFDQKKFGYMSCSLSRNLHCWGISASFIPVGPFKSYYVSLRVNSSMLQDLKYEQRGRSSSFDPEWY